MKRFISFALAILILLMTPLTTCGYEIPNAKYNLSNEERTLLEYAVMSEASTDFYGQALIAECALNTALLNGWSIFKVLEEYNWINRYVEPSESCKRAVHCVFDLGYSPSGGELITVFYNPLLLKTGTSSYHESQIFVLEWKNVRYFREKRFNKFKLEDNNMNDARRKEISDIIERLDILIERVNSLCDTEQEVYDNLPENFQMTERGEAVLNAIEGLENAATALEDAAEHLTDARDGN